MNKQEQTMLSEFARGIPREHGGWRRVYSSKEKKLAEDEATKARAQGLTMRVREEIKKGRAFSKPFVSYTYIVEVKI